MTATWPLRRKPSSKDDRSDEEQDSDLNCCKGTQHNFKNDFNNVVPQCSPKPRLSIHSKWYYDKYNVIDDVKNNDAANRDVDRKFKETLSNENDALAIYHVSVLNDIRALTTLMIGDAGVIDAQTHATKLTENINRLVIIYVNFVPQGKEETINETNIVKVILQRKSYNKHLEFLFEFSVEMIVVELTLPIVILSKLFDATMCVINFIHKGDVTDKQKQDKHFISLLVEKATLTEIHVYFVQVLYRNLKLHCKSIHNVRNSFKKFLLQVYDEHVEELAIDLSVNDKLSDDDIKTLIDHMKNTSIDYCGDKFVQLYPEWSEMVTTVAKTAFVDYYSKHFEKRAKKYVKRPPSSSFEKPVSR